MYILVDEGKVISAEEAERGLRGRVIRTPSHSLHAAHHFVRVRDHFNDFTAHCVIHEVVS